MALPGTSLEAVAARPRVSPQGPSAASVARRTDAGPDDDDDDDDEEVFEKIELG